MINQFSVSFGSATMFVDPIAVKNLKVTEQPEGTNIFFRRKISAVKLGGEDFAFLYRIENSTSRCEDVFFKWQRACSEDSPLETLFSGVFNVSDAKWDLDTCTVEFTPKPNDAYRLLLDNYTIEQNVLLVGDTVTTTGKLETSQTFEFKEINIGELSDQDQADTWASFLQVTSWVTGTVFTRGTRNNIEIIFRVRTTRPLINGVPVDLSGSGWSLIDTDSTTAFYAKAPEVYGFQTYKIGSWGDWDNHADIKLVPAMSIFDPNKYVSLNRSGANDGACGGNGLRIRTYLGDDRCWDILWEFGTFTFTRNRRLLDVTRYLIRQSDPALEPSTNEELSIFFTSPINYVTNKTNKLRNPLIAQLSDIKRFRSSEAATKGMLALSAALTDLASTFNVFWFVNSKGKIQIEHLSFFGSYSSFDLTDKRFLKQVSGTKKYEYLKSKMPRFEKLQFAIAQNEEFTESVIEYMGECVVKTEGEDTTTISVSKWTTDIEGIMVSGDSFPDAGFVIIGQDGTSVIPKDYGGFNTKQYLNGHLSATNLFETYFKDGRVLPSGLLNGKTVFFNSVVRTKKQNDITIPLCCEPIDPTGRFATTLPNGNDGRAASITYALDGSATFSIVHNSFTATNVLDLSGGQFNESFNQSFPD